MEIFIADSIIVASLVGPPLMMVSPCLLKRRETERGRDRDGTCTPEEEGTQEGEKRDAGREQNNERR